MSIKQALKRARASQPFNRLAASALKGLFAATGWRSEFVIKHLPRTGAMSVPLPGGRALRLNASGEDWIPTQLFWRGWLGYEPEVTPLFYQLAQQTETIFDVGAHVGFFSLLAAIANPNARVFAFEPLARIFARLEQNIALNKLTNLRPLCVAVGERAGVQDFYFPESDAPVASSLRSDMLLASLPPEVVQHVPVPVVTLDQIVAEYNIARVGLVKLDTERTEHEVLAGARLMLARDHPDIFCEVWPDAGNARQLTDLLRPLGYRFFQLTNSGTHEHTEIAGSTQDLNYLFTVRPAEIGL